MAVFKFIADNYVNFFVILIALIGVAELIVRLTPTISDDGAVERFAKVVKKICDFLKIPNNLK